MSYPRSSPRLANYPFLRTSDVDEAREVVGKLFCPHLLEPDSASGLAVVHNSVSVGSISLNFMDYGGPVHIVPGEMVTMGAILMPLSGKSLISCGKQKIVSTPFLASVPTSTEPLDMHWNLGTPQLVLKFDCPVLEGRLTQELGYDPPRPIKFRLGMNLASLAGAHFKSEVLTVVKFLERGGDPTRYPRWVATFEESIHTMLLKAQPHNYFGRLQVSEPAVSSKVVRAAIDYIEAHAEQIERIGDIAKHGAVSLRALQKRFRLDLDCTPHEYLCRVRLRRARETLSAADPTERKVGSIALEWGFMHPSRFAAAYRAEFGEYPNDTLRGGRWL